MLAAEYLSIESSRGKAAADAWLAGEAQKAGPQAERFKSEFTTPRSRSPAADQDKSSEPRQIAELPGSTGDSPSPPDADEGRVEPAQQKNDPASPPNQTGPRRPPATDEEREEREEAVRKEGLERFRSVSHEQWKERFEILLEISKREGFLPRPFVRHLWGQFRDRHASIDERLDAARAIAELQILFPQEAERFFGKGELLWVSEIVRLDDEGELPPDRLIDRAASNVRFVDLRRVFEGGVLAGGAASIAVRRRRGLKAEGLGEANLRSSLHRHGIEIQTHARYETSEGLTIVDFKLLVGRNKRILRLIEHKTPLATYHGDQKLRQKLAAESEGVSIDLMRTDPKTGVSTVNGLSFRKYVRDLLREIRRSR